MAMGGTHGKTQSELVWDVGQAMPNYPHKWSDRLRSNFCQSSTVM
jgi:hypothetical protein